MLYNRHTQKFLQKKLFSTFYTSASIRSIIQNSAKLITVQVIAAFLLFANNYIVIRLCGDQVYGSYVSLMAWVNFFNVIVIFGFDDYFIAVLPKIAGDQNPEKNALPVLLRSLLFILSIFFIVTVVLSVFIYFNFFTRALQQNSVYFFALILVLSVLGVLIAFLRGINKSVYSQVIDKLLRPGLMIFFTVMVFIVIKELNLKLILLIQIAVLVTVIFFIGFRLKKSFDAFHWPENIFQKSLKVNVAFLFISILNLLSVRLDILFLTRVVVPEQVGYYNLGVRMADVIGFPLSAMNLVVPAFLSKEMVNNPLNIKKVINNTSFVAFASTLLIYVPAILFGRYLLPFFGQRFIDGYWPMVILGGTYLISSFCHQRNGYLMISGRQNYCLFCLIINVVSVFIFCRLLLPAYGLIGAAFSVFLGNIFYCIAVIIAYNKATVRLS